MTNPFTLSFGKTPNEYISRLYQSNQIIESLTSDNPLSHVYMITGVRGSGKTVLLTGIAREFNKRDDWLVINLNPERDLLTSLASKIYDSKVAHAILTERSFGFSFAGINASLKESRPVIDIEFTLEIMLKELSKRGLKLLVTIDEATNNEHIRVFTSAFQILIREDLPIFMLMTGLYDNIHDLENEKALTFLYRAPKIIIEPLKLGAIALSYQRIFETRERMAVELSKLTNGYAFAYQVLGYLMWEHKDEIGDGIPEIVIEQFDRYLEDFVYEKIWSELSPWDKKIMEAIAESENFRVSEILELAGIEKNKLSVYRDRLNKKGLLDVSERGYMRVALPRFPEFVKKMKIFEL